MEKNSKVAVVTGASGGIGRAVALRLARDGVAVVVHYSGNAAKAEETIAEIKGGGGRAIAVQANVAIVADVEHLFQTAVDTFGAIDVVVNCAGIMPLVRIADGDMEVFDQVIATNLRGAFIVLGQAARHVAPGGLIIVFSSNVVQRGSRPMAPILLPKQALRGWCACSPMSCVAATSQSTPWPQVR